ncbi:MAG TPA: hypothetical protein VEU11_17595 [Terriglobales bacterium]|nr:hypothetical protein [Terriglobales bacterium]
MDTRAVEETVKLYGELEGLTARYLAQQVALKSGNLEAQTRLVQRRTGR